MDDTRIRLALQSDGGVLVRRHHPELAGTIDWWVRTGRLARVLPGVYAPAELADQPTTRMVAACAAQPDAVLVGAAAARVSFWPGAPLDVVEVAARTQLRSTARIHFCRRRIPTELVVAARPLRFAAPALTALDLATLDDAKAVDIALRSRMATLAQMRDALAATPGRPGNRERLRVLVDSRDEPWSEAERRAHRLLRAAGITGWTANLAVSVRGRRYYLDIAFARERLVIEIDGRIHEQDLRLFESDRWRQNALVQAGWCVLRFTWAMLVEHPEEFLREVTTALEIQRQMRRGGSSGPRQRIWR
jgi:very-short-patch-repair endonuclease